MNFKYTIDPAYLKYIDTHPFTDTPLNLTNKIDKHKYFRHKAGDQIDALTDYLKKNQVVIYMLAPKFAGKGVYSGLLRELFPGLFEHISVGDLIREFPKTYAQDKENLLKALEKLYRGPMPLKEVIDLVLNPDPTKLVPDEFILALLKYKISQMDKKSLILDGFPRTQDQVYYALLFRDLIDYRDDKDIFLFINIPFEVIDLRAKYRVVCPECKLSRNTKMLLTEIVEYDKDSGQFYLVCDNPQCKGYKKQRLYAKPGDELGIKAYLPRIKNDLKLMEFARNLHGISRIELYNAVPADFIGKHIQDYEVTPFYEFEATDSGVKITSKPWTFQMDGVDYVSFLAPAVGLQLIRQLFEIAGLAG